MNPEVVTVTPDDTLATALKLTRKHRIRHLTVVLPTSGVAGILSDRDIRLAQPSPLTVADAERMTFLEQTLIAEVMTREVITIGPEETIEDAAKLLYQHRIGVLPVMDARGRLRGILTETDILHAFVRILGVATPSSRLELELRDEPGELGRALTLISAGGLNVVSVVVIPYGKNAERKVAVIHLATIDPRESIRALEDAGFEVGWPSFVRDVRNLGEPRATG